MSDPSTAPEGTERPPVAAFEDVSIRGTRCQDQVTMSGRTIPAGHDGCPGWWAGLDDEAGFTCGCDCHEERGWPGFAASQINE